MSERRYRSELQALGVEQKEAKHADDFFRGLGATSVDVMDVSEYEGANILHDLNQPVSTQLTDAYDCVFDGGATEHVFNFPMALKNCMEMVKVGGHLIVIAPWNNYAGQGFYQLSPELFYSALSAENGYRIRQMLVVRNDNWYAVANPKEVGERVELINREPTLLFLTAERLAKKTIFAAWPQQSDYSAEWTGNLQIKEDSGIKLFLLERSQTLRALRMRWRAFKHRNTSSVSNQKCFQPVKLLD